MTEIDILSDLVKFNTIKDKENKFPFENSFCYSKDNREKRWMSVAEFEHILKEIKPYTKTIYLHVKGGYVYQCNLLF